MKRLQQVIQEATAERDAVAEKMLAVAKAFQEVAKSALEVYGAEVGSASDRHALRSRIDTVTTELQKIQSTLESR